MYTRLSFVRAPDFPLLAERKIGVWTGRRGRVELHYEHGVPVLLAA
jgi:hypothetical protein